MQISCRISAEVAGWYYVGGIVTSEYLNGSIHGINQSSRTQPDDL
jgi:hypothetical protein